MRTKEESPVPYIPLAESEITICEQIMREGNAPLRDWHNKVKDIYGKRKYPRYKFRHDFFVVSVDRNFPVRIAGHIIPVDDVKKIWSVKDIEEKLICGFSAMIWDLANKWSSRNGDVSLESGDLFEEGITAFMRAIFHYINEEQRFSTFAYHAIRRRLMTVCIRTQPLSPLPELAVDLYKEFRDIKQQANGPIGMDAIVEKMGLNKKHREVLQAMLTTVINQSQLEPSDASEKRKHKTDFSVLAKNFIGGDSNFRVSGHQNGGPIVVREQSEDDMGIRQAIDAIKADLKEFDLIVFERFLADPERGWMIKAAKELINPATNKHYTRMAITYAWQRIQKRFAAEFNRRAA